MFRHLISAIIGVCALLLLGEGAFRILPVSSATMAGYYRDADLLTYPSHHQWRMATGWDLRNPQTLTSNNWGFAAKHDFLPNENAVALIGDSYVESSMIDQESRPAEQLERMIGQRKVYAMGTPGTALLDYAQRIRVAHTQFGVKDFVLLLEQYDARQSLCGSGNVVSRCLNGQTYTPSIERRPEPTGVKLLLRHSALAQYLTSQLRFNLSSLAKAALTRNPPDGESTKKSKRPPAPPTPAQVDRTITMVDAVVGEFFATAGPHLQGQVIFLVDGRRAGVAQHHTLIDAEREHLMRRLREHGAIVHDLESIYAAHAVSSRRSLDVGPYDGHLNAEGIRLAMEPAAHSLLGEPLPVVTR